MPAVSALILNYNYGRFLGEAVASVLNQTVSDYEIVVADDGSVDDTLDVVKSFPDGIIKFITGPHVGLASNMARGLRACEGEIVAFLSADDLWLPHHLEVGIETLDRMPHAALSYSAMQRIDEAGQPIPVPPTLKAPAWITGMVRPRTLLQSNFIYTQTVLARCDVIDEIGGIDERLTFAELDLFVRIVERYPIVHSGQTTVQYRIHSNSMSQDSEHMLACRLELYDKHFGPTLSKEKRWFVAQAHLRTAYEQLMPAATPASVKAARKNIFRAFRLQPGSALRALNVLMLVAACLGRWFVSIQERFGARFAHSRAKLLLQRVLGIAR